MKSSGRIIKSRKEYLWYLNQFYTRPKAKHFLRDNYLIIKDVVDISNMPGWDMTIDKNDVSFVVNTINAIKAKAIFPHDVFIYDEKQDSFKESTAVW